MIDRLSSKSHYLIKSVIGNRHCVKEHLFLDSDERVTKGRLPETGDDWYSTGTFEDYQVTIICDTMKAALLQHY